MFSCNAILWYTYFERYFQILKCMINKTMHHYPLSSNFVQNEKLKQMIEIKNCYSTCLFSNWIF